MIDLFDIITFIFELANKLKPLIENEGMNSN